MKKLIILGILMMVLLAVGCQQTPALQNITDLKAYPDGEDISISWSPSPDANSYYVYRQDTHQGGYYYWGVTDKNTITDVTVTEGQWYAYRVYPALSTEDGYVRSDVYQSTDRVLALPQPVITSIERKGNQCTIRWARVDDANTYMIYRKMNDRVEMELVGETSENHYTDTLAPSIRCTYTIVMNAKVNQALYASVPSQPVMSHPVPEIQSALREDHYTVVVDWTGDEEGVEYGIYRRLNDQVGYDLIAQTSNTYYRDTSAPFTTILAVNEDGSETIQTNNYEYSVRVISTGHGEILQTSASTPQRVQNAQDVARFLAIRYEDFIDSRDDNGAMMEGVVNDYEFEKDLKYLQDNQYVTITSKLFLDYIYNETSFPENAVMLTFDGGKRGFYEHAYPLLVEYNMMGILSVQGQLIDQAEPGGTYCTWDEIREMVDSGHVELAAGSYALYFDENDSEDHRIGVTKLSYETIDQYQLVLQEDIPRIQEKIQQITGQPASIFAYPLGARDEVSDAVLMNEFNFGILLADDDARATRMNYFITGADPNTHLMVINRRDRAPDVRLEKYIVAAEYFDDPDMVREGG